MATIEITAQNLKSTIENNPIVFLDFWADWCGPCKQFGPVFEKASEKHPDIVFGKVDTEAQQEVAAAFGIQSIPTLAIFKQGELIFMQPGALPAHMLEQIIAKVRELDMSTVQAEGRPSSAGTAANGKAAGRDSPPPRSREPAPSSAKVVTTLAAGEGLALMAGDYALRRQGVTREFLEKAGAIPTAVKALEFYRKVKESAEQGRGEELQSLRAAWMNLSGEINAELSTLDADTRSEIRAVLRAIEQLIKA